MVKNKNELSKLSENTIKMLKSIEKRLMKKGLLIGLAYQLSDITLKRMLEYVGSEGSFQTLRRNIETLYKSYKHKVYIDKNGKWNTGEVVENWFKEKLKEKRKFEVF